MILHYYTDLNIFTDFQIFSSSQFAVQGRYVFSSQEFADIT